MEASVSHSVNAFLNEDSGSLSNDEPDLSHAGDYSSHMEELFDEDAEGSFTEAILTKTKGKVSYTMVLMLLISLLVIGNVYWTFLGQIIKKMMGPSPTSLKWKVLSYMTKYNHTSRI